MSELNDLISDLKKAEILASKFSGGYSNQFDSADEFYSELKNSINKFKNGEENVLNDLSNWFAPTCSWDDFIGLEGLELGNNIFERIEKIKKAGNTIYSK